MTKSFRLFRWLAVGAVACAATACGGSDSVANVALDGTATGLTADGLVLTLNEVANIALAANTSAFSLPRLIPGESYSIAILTQPANLTCRVSNGAGVADTADITNVIVTCGPNHSLGGTIAGLAGAGLALANGSDTVNAAAGSASFVFPAKVGEGQAYGVTILSQPAGQTCTVQNGAGIMGSADVANVSVTCV